MRQSSDMAALAACYYIQSYKVFEMVVTKRCAWGTCKNDSRYPSRMVRNNNGDPVTFFHFPGEKRHPKRRKQWILACRRGDNFVCSKDSYICSLHFVGENGPSKNNPDPISATASKERVGLLRIMICTKQQLTYSKGHSFHFDSIL